MRWHLYLDESGNFDSGNYSLIGGFMLPEMSDQKAKMINPQSWLDEAKTYVRTNMQDIPSSILDQYNYHHCSENVDNYQVKMRIQPVILGLFCEKIASYSGKLIILDNPEKSTSVDNTTTYLAMMAKGLLYLYHELFTGSNRDNSLCVHISERLNRTFKFESEKLKVSPTRAAGGNDAAVIKLDQYKNALEYSLYLLASKELQGDPKLKEMIRSIEILKNKGENIPYTTVCDYVCNTYLSCVSGSRSRRRDWLKYDACQKFADTNFCHIINTTSDRRLEVDAIQKAFDENHSAAIFLQLLNEEFPPIPTQKFYALIKDRTNLKLHLVHESYVKGLIADFYTEVYNHDDYLAVERRLYRTLEDGTQFLPQTLQAKLKANISLFLLALHTHIGNEQKAMNDCENFELNVRNCDDETRRELQLLYLNRRIVLDTDAFQYEHGEQLFEALDKYWTSITKTNQFLGLSTQSSRNEEFGKAIGSYLQLCRNRFRQDGHAERLAETFELYFPVADEQFVDPQARSRLYQTASDIMADLGDPEESFQLLLKATLLSKGNNNINIVRASITLANCKQVLKASVEYPYLLQHYVRIIYLAIHQGKQELAEKLLQPISFRTFDDFNYINDIHIRTQVMWHLGVCLVRMRPNAEGNANAMLNQAISLLRNTDQRIFLAIAIAIQADQIALYLEKNREIGRLIENMLLTYTRYSRLNDETNAKNPYLNMGISNLTRETALLKGSSYFRHIAYQIGY